jgi:hypothetical protein
MIAKLSHATMCAFILCASCSSSNNPGSGASAGSTATSAQDASTGSAQTPPMGGTAVEAWLALGYYKDWHCETAVHASRSPSPHNFNRICSNDIINANATGTGTWPAGAAAVKELYNAATDTTPVGYAVYLKTQADSANGANWYWYERVPTTGLQSAAPHDAAGVVADGLGSTGTPLTICVACHSAVASDAAHTPSVGGRDYVYTPVQ